MTQATIDAELAPMTELDQIRQRYERRAQRGGTTSSAFSRAMIAEREAIYRRLLHDHAGGSLAQLAILEIGCGAGGELARLIELGCSPERLVGNELLPERLAHARAALPSEVRLFGGDASTLALPDGSFDVVFQSTVFTSILDPDLQERLARRMWQLLRPGGAILWYDFVVNNPMNPDVRGVSRKRVRELFPVGSFQTWRVTLAPPIGRRVAGLGGWAYRALAFFPFLRTHCIAWIVKPSS